MAGVLDEEVVLTQSSERKAQFSNVSATCSLQTHSLNLPENEQRDVRKFDWMKYDYYQQKLS